MFDDPLRSPLIEDIFETKIRRGEASAEQISTEGTAIMSAASLSTVATATTRLRLTRRGRIVFGGFATVLVAVLLALVAVFASPSAQASEANGAGGNGAEFSYIVVQPGESLWSVATALDPAVDPRDLVGEIVQLNKLSESGVQAGQPLAVPLRYSDSPIAVSADEVGL